MYYFYSRNDSKKESIGKVEANSFKEALKYISEIKKLSRTQFLKLYEISNKTDGKKRFTFRRD